jgi:hypothetical protein
MNEQLRTSYLLRRPAGFGHPDEVVNHPRMSKAEKRAILASWASDARAMSDCPALRKLDDGAVIRIDDILYALCMLDEDDDPPPSPAAAAIPVRWPVLDLHRAA